MVNEAAAQQNEVDDSSLSPTEVAEILGLSASISGVISALVTYKLSKKLGTEERQRQAIKDRVSLYSLFIFNLMRMIENPEFRTRTENPTKIAETVKEMDDMMKDYFYTIEQILFKKWLSVRSDWKQKYLNNHQNFIGEVVDLRNMVVKLYNKSIPIYEKNYR
jgi:hypothetical protein